MADILNYTGNAGLGLGGGSVPSVGVPDLDQIGQTARDIMLQDNQWNVIKYRQKVEDREKFRQLVTEGQIAQGELLPEYQPVFDRAQKRIEDYFQEHGADLINDPNKFRQYQSLVRDAKDAAAHGQVNTREIRKLELEKSKATLPADQERIQKHIDAQKQSTTQKYWNSVTPYQKMHNMAIKDILDVPAARTSSYLDRNDPFASYDSTTVDYQDILRHKQNQYLNDQTGEAADSFDQFFKQLQDYDPIELGKTLSSIDNQIVRYNKERGFTKDSPGFVQPVRRTLVGGRVVIEEPKAEFVAKYALANQPQFVTKTNKFNKEVGSYLVAKERANTDAVYKRIMAGNAGQRTRAYVDNVKSQIAARKKPEDQEEFMDEMYNRNLLNQDSLIKPSKEQGKVDFKPIQADQSLPVLTIENGKVTQLIPLGAKKLYDKNKKVIGYEGGHYEPQYMIGGRRVDPQSIANKYKTYKENGGTEPSFDAFLKKAIERNQIDFLIKGANGVVDRKLSRATQRALSNKNTDKGEEGIFDVQMPVDEQLPDSTTPQE